MNKEDMIGKRFGKLTVINESPPKNGRRCWRCSCDCGNETIVMEKNLKNGITKSCGCLRLERVHEAKTVHGESGGKIVGERTALYRCWSNMKSRCYNENVRSYADYGAKGIEVCDEWRNDFTKFSEWAYTHNYQDSLTIERIDPTKNYCPENCEWITLSENSRRAHNKYCWAKNIVTGEYVEFWGIRNFAKERDLDYKAIDRVLHGRAKTCNDWIFGYQEK